MNEDEKKRATAAAASRENIAKTISLGSASGGEDPPPRFPRTRTSDSDSGGPAPDKNIGLTRTRHAAKPIDALTLAIEKSTEQLSFRGYKQIIDLIMCQGKPAETPPSALSSAFTKVELLRRLPFPDVDKYRLLKVATEAFMTINGEIVTEDLGNYLEPVDVIDPEIKDGTINILPYLAIIRRKFPELDIKPDKGSDEECFGLLQEKLQHPFMIELIWSYWHEEAMLVQTLNAISMRFQNRRVGTGRDPLAQLEIDPLRSLSNILWGYIQDEQHRLTVARRAYEYLHHYGITLQGKAVPKLDYAESRSKFIEACHTLLNITSKFYLQYDDTTV